MTETSTNIKSEQENRITKQVSTPASAGTLPWMNAYIPYLIAISFVGMTALLTLMLTVVMENKAELERSVTFNTSEPLLANARVAFGHTIISGEAAPERFIDDEIGKGQATPLASPATQAFPDKPEPGPGSSQSAVVEIVGTGGESENVRSAIYPEAAVLTSAIDATQDPTAAEAIPVPVNPAQTDGTVVTITQNVDLTEQGLSTARHDPSNTLENIVMAHNNTITGLENAIAQKAYNREQLQAMVIYNLNLMENQIRRLENSLRPAFPPALAAYERMVSKRRESFGRMLQRRQEILYRAQQSRDVLRENYSQLLDLLSSRTAMNLV